MTTINDEMKCEPCQKGGAPMSMDNAVELLKQIDNWEIINNEGVHQLSKCFSFKNFVEALNFTNRLGELAESENHPPAILTEWGKVTVTWWTHEINGLHKNDFICAARTDDVLSKIS